MCVCACVSVCSAYTVRAWRLFMQSNMLSPKTERVCQSAHHCSFYGLSAARLNVFQFSPCDNSALSLSEINVENIINGFATSRFWLQPCLSLTFSMPVPFLSLIYLSLCFPCCPFFTVFLQVSYLVVVARANKVIPSAEQLVGFRSYFEFSRCNMAVIVSLTKKEEFHFIV